MDVDDEKVLNVVPDVYEESDSGGSQDEGKPKKKQSHLESFAEKKELKELLLIHGVLCLIPWHCF